MIELKIDNSDSVITGITIEQYRQLRELLSYKNSSQSYFQNRFYNPKKYLLDKKGCFPTGLLYIVEDFLKLHKIVYQRNDIRRAPMPQDRLFTMSIGQTPYDEQIAAAKAFKAQGGRGIITAPTGVGKSLITILIINEMQVPTLIIVPSLELKRQMTESIKQAFGSQFGSKGSSIWVENIDSLDTSEVYADYKCVIIDEFHHSGAKTYRKLNKKALSRTYYRCGLTATPFRSQDHERLLLESILSKIIYKIDYRLAVDKGYIVPLEAYYYALPKRKSEGYTWAQVYSELIVNNDYRNNLIAILLKKLKENGISTLCLIKEIKHGEILSNLTKIHFANGQSEDSRDLIAFFSQDKLKALIGTTGILGEGIDTKPAEFIIIAGLGKSKNAFHQQIGRGFRRFLGKETCKVILFRDDSNKWTKDHFKMQVKYLKEDFGVVPIKLDLLI